MVARLIDPAGCHRTAPCPQLLGEGMTGSRTNPALPQRICTITTLEKAHNHTISIADLPASAESMHRPDPASRPFVLATLRALRLDPGPYPMPPTRRPKISKIPGRQLLTEPHPFRDGRSAADGPTARGLDRTTGDTGSYASWCATGPELVAIRSGLKAQVHAVLAKAGVLIAVSDLFGVTGRQRLATVPLGSAYAERVRSLLELIDVLDDHEARFAGLIAKQFAR